MESMTGMAVANGSGHARAWTWTVRSVNGKSFDLRCRLPAGFDDLDAFVRDTLKKNFLRGSFQVSLDLAADDAVSANVKINENLLSELCAVSERYCERYRHLTVSFDGLLAVAGVVEKKRDAEDDGADADALKRSFEDAVCGLKKARAAEGEKMKLCLADELRQIDSLADEARKITLETPEILTERLKTLIQAARETAGVTEERLAQEVALCLIRADVREEIDRLQAHVKTGVDLLDASEACGKKLDFLCQELNRETNTLCSKSADIALTRVGLALKSVIDQFREQVQNIE